MDNHHFPKVSANRNGHMRVEQDVYPVLLNHPGNYNLFPVAFDWNPGKPRLYLDRILVPAKLPATGGGKTKSGIDKDVFVEAVDAQEGAHNFLRIDSDAAHGLVEAFEHHANTHQ